MIGETILHYKIIEKLGEGGMGEVYKAKDTKLDRFVALKFLPSQITSTEENKARFVQEAKAASAMNHPNVCTIYDIQENNGRLFIVMEYIDGVTLRDNRQPLSVKRILDIGIQAAEGLAAAHEKGIVHRDIKPENIMLRKDGIVQIMDFGLAKLFNTGNITRLTKAGTTMGTIGYMSPEQVQGLDVDHRTDIFSLGVVLYELLAGEAPFKGVHETAMMYEIVNVDPPPVSAVKEGIDPLIDGIVQECLEKDKDERYQSASELARNLRKIQRTLTVGRATRTYNTNLHGTEVKSGHSTAAGAPVKSSIGDIPVRNLFRNIFYNPKIFWTVSSVLLLAVALLLLFSLNRKEPEVQVIKATILPPQGINYDNSLGSNLTISPDGRFISFIGTDSTGTSKLWIRPINSLTARPLTNADPEAYPFWSPNSDIIAYFDRGKLMKISLDAGTSLPVCDAVSGRGGSWSQKGTIVLSPNPIGGIYKVPSSGGKPEEIIKPDTANKNQSMRWSYFLPDGNHFLYSTENSSTGSSSGDAIYVSSLSDPKSEKLISASSNCQYASGYLLFVRQSILLAQKFDPDKLIIEGEAMPISENIQYYDVRISGTFATSQNGKLVYQDESLNSQSTVLIDKNGKEIKRITNQKSVYSATFSPDGNRITYDLYDAGEKNINIWTYDLNRNVSTRLTFNKASNIFPKWTKDGRKIIFSSNINNNVYDSFIKNADGSGDANLLFKSDYTKVATDISADGNYILYQCNNVEHSTNGWDIRLLDKNAEKSPVNVLATNFDEFQAVFSTDLKWIAYESNESGKSQIYIIPFNSTGINSAETGKWQISVNGGINPKWMNNGKSVYFFTPDNKIMSVDINESGSSISPGKPFEIFKPGNQNIAKLDDVNKDGTEIIAAIYNGQINNSTMTAVVNWATELEKRK